MDTTARRRLGARTAAKSCGLHPSPTSATCHVAVMARGLGDGPVVCYVFHLASSFSGRSRALRGTRGRAGDSGPKRSHSPEGQHRQMLALKFLTSASCCWGQSDQTSRFKSSQPADPAPWGQSLDEARPDHGSAPVLVVERHGESCRPPHDTEPHREITPSVDRLGSRPPTAVAVTATSPQRATAHSGPRRQRTGYRPNACAGTAARKRSSSSRARHRVRSTRRIASTPRGLGLRRILPPPWRGRVQAVPHHPLLVGNPRSLRGLANAGS